jgi:hypothetical protein
MTILDKVIATVTPARTRECYMGCVRISRDPRRRKET